MRKPGFGFVTLTCLVIANMIGAGVFTTSGFALADLGTPARVLATWLVGGALAFCGALSYAALVRRLSESGGEYLFLARALHPLVGFLAGWVSLLAGFSGAIAFAALAFEAYLLPAGTRPVWLPPGTLAMLAVLVAGLAHGLRLEAGAIAQNLLVLFKLVLFLVLMAWGAAGLLSHGAAGAAPRSVSEPLDLARFATATLWVSLSYSGFNAAVYVAGEARGGAPTVARALVAGTVLVTLIYVFLNALFVYGAPYLAIAGREDVAARAAWALGGEPLARLTRLLIVVALATSVSSMVMAGPRVYARMAADGVFPALFHERDGRMPGSAVALQVVLAIVIIRIADLRTLLSYLGFTLSLSTAATVATLFVLRAREGVGRVPVTGYPWVPGFYVAGTALLAVIAALDRPLEPLLGLATLAVGVVAYGLFRRRSSAAT